MTDSSAQYSRVQRRLLTAAGGLGVVALAGATFVLSYDDLRMLAIRGGADRHRAFLYPAMLDGLIVVVVLSILAARRSRWWARAGRWFLLLVLVAGAGAAGLERAVRGYGHLSRSWVSGGVAVAPWVILALAVWLWTSMIKQAVRARRADASPDPVPVSPPIVDGTIVPGFDEEELRDTRPLPRPASARPLERASEPDHRDADTVRSVEPLPDASTAPGTAYAEEAGSAHDDAPGQEPSPVRSTGPAQGTPRRDEPLLEPRPPLVASSVPASRPAGDLEPPRGPVRGLESGPAPEPDDEQTRGPGSDPEDPPVTPLDEDTAPRWVARASLPTDVRLVGPPKTGGRDTRPDGIDLADTDPDGIPMLGVPGAAGGTARPDADDRAPGEPPAGDDDVEATPPSSKFRSSPTPPSD